tara:strand:- start:26 stop:241 length:216 start_codon:yes stop_codon:yes gene_type:complete
MAVTELKLTDTIGQMRDKINEIINTIDGNSVKIYDSDGTNFIELTFDNSTLIAKLNGTGDAETIFDFTSNP